MHVYNAILGLQRVSSWQISGLLACIELSRVELSGGNGAGAQHHSCAIVRQRHATLLQSYLLCLSLHGNAIPLRQTDTKKALHFVYR